MVGAEAVENTPKLPGSIPENLAIQGEIIVKRRPQVRLYWCMFYHVTMK